MDDFSPYKSPQSYFEAPKPNNGVAKPAVVTWCKFYVGFMAGLYLILAVAGVLLLAFSGDLADPKMDEMELQFMGAIYGALGFIFSIVFGIGLFVPRRGWGWIYSIVLICIGLTSCCTLPVCIPLLIFWLKAETKTYYGMSS